MSRGWLIVFGKAPRPGLVKTRMSPPLSLGQSAELYRSMLTDVLAASVDFAAVLDLIPVLAFHPPEAVAEMIDLAPKGIRLHVQRGDDLGERMANAFAEAFASGAERVLLRGSDSPALERSLFETALRRLDTGDDLVLTPDQNGGYAMMALRAPQPRLFEPSMSTEEVLEKTTRIADSLGLRSSKTALGFGLNTVGDFRNFDRLSNALLLDLCPNTVESISSSAIRDVL